MKKNNKLREKIEKIIMNNQNTNLDDEMKKIREEFKEKYTCLDYIDSKRIVGYWNDYATPCFLPWTEVLGFIEAQLKKQRQEGYNDCIKHRIDDFNRNLKSRDLAGKYDAKHNTKKN